MRVTSSIHAFIDAFASLKSTVVNILADMPIFTSGGLLSSGESARVHATNMPVVSRVTPHAGIAKRWEAESAAAE